MQCSRCGYQMEPWDTQCPNCARAGQQVSPPPPPLAQPVGPQLNPPQPPAPSSPLAHQHPAWTHTLGRYQSPTGIGTGLCILLGFLVPIYGIVGLMHFGLTKMPPLIPGSLVQPTDTVGALVLQGLVALFGGVMLIASIICWCIWNYRVYSNIIAFGARELRFTPGWAIGWYFVPFMQLIRPYQAMEEMWKASDPDVDLNSGTEWHSGSVPTIVSAWWMLVFFPLYLAIFAMAAIGGPNHPQTWGAEHLINGIHTLLLAADAVLAILMVRQLTARQEDKYRRLYNAFYTQPAP